MKHTPHIIIATILSFVARYVDAEEAPFIGRGLDSGAYNLLTPLPGIGPKVTELSDYLHAMFYIGLGLAAVFAVVMIVYGGFQYILSVTPFGKGDGKAKIVDALIGLAMAFGAVLILQTIDPNLTKFSLKIDPLRVNIKPATTRNDQIDELYLKLGRDAKVGREAYQEFIKQADAKEIEATTLERTDAFGNFDRIQALRREAEALRKDGHEQYIKNIYDISIKGSYERAINDTAENTVREKENMIRQYRILTDDLRNTNADPALIQKLQLETNFKIFALDTKQEMDKITEVGLLDRTATHREQIIKLKEIDKKVDLRYQSAKVHNPESAQQVNNDIKKIVADNIVMIKKRCAGVFGNIKGCDDL